MIRVPGYTIKHNALTLGLPNRIEVGEGGESVFLFSLPKTLSLFYSFSSTQCSPYSNVNHTNISAYLQKHQQTSLKVTVWEP